MYENALGHRYLYGTPTNTMSTLGQNTSMCPPKPHELEDDASSTPRPTETTMGQDTSMCPPKPDELEDNASSS